jgi:hypothetical protein
MISFQQGFGLTLHGIGHAFVVSSTLEGAGWMQNEPVLVKNALKISQALLAVQITLVSFQCCSQVLQIVTVLSALYSAAVAAFYFRNYLPIYYLARFGVLLMSIGSLLFGFGSSNTRRPQQVLQKSFGQGQRKLEKTTPFAPTAEMSGHVTVGKDQSSSSLLRHRKHRDGSIPFDTSTSCTVLPSDPDLEKKKTLVSLPTHHAHNIPATVSTTQHTATPLTTSTRQNSTSTAPALSSRHGAAYVNPSNHRVAIAFQRDPYQIDLSDILTQINDTNDDNEIQVFTPDYFTKRTPTMEDDKGKAPSSSSSLEICEEDNRKPYIL